MEKLLDREEKRAAKKARREAQKQAAEAWRKRWQALGDEARAATEARKARGSVLRTAEKEIDRAIEEGVTALVTALGKRAASAAQTLSGAPRTEFDRYVAKQKQPAPAAAAASRSGPIVTPPPRTRVAEPEEEADLVEDEVRVRARRRR